jgi:multiple sugar transport system substrate-binding protein
LRLIPVLNLIVLAGIATMLLPRCQSRPDLQFAVGGTPDELAFWETLIERFARESGTTVGLLRQPTDTDLQRQLLVTVLSSRLPQPDVFLLDVAWVSQLAASGWLEPLEPYVRSGVLAVAPYEAPALADIDHWRQQLIALPVSIDGGVLYCRKDLLDSLGLAVPETWDELVRDSHLAMRARRAAQPGFFGFVWPGAQYEGLTCSWLEFTASAGGGFIDTTQGLRVDTPANIEATELMHDLIHPLAVSPPNTDTEMREEQVRLFFERGDALCERNWPYAWSRHQESTSPVRGRVVMAALPHAEGHRAASALGGWHLAMSRFSTNKEAAARFMAFVLSFPVQKELVSRLGWYSARRDIYGDPELLATQPNLAQLARLYELLRPRPAMPWYTLISEVMQRRVSGVLTERQAPAEALREAQQEIARIARRYGD